MSDEAKAINRLRTDAIERGMLDLAIAYGVSVIRLNEEEIGRKLTQIEMYRMAKDGGASSNG